MMINRILLFGAVVILVGWESQGFTQQVRVSVKHVLSASGNRSSGPFGSNQEIIDTIDEANLMLSNSGVFWQLQLTEIRNVEGISEFFRLDTDDEFEDLRVGAIESPDTYMWNPRAINIYIVSSLGDAAGLCCANGVANFPPKELVVIGNNLFQGASLWLHEIGHYLSLRHTFSCAELDCTCVKDLGILCPCRGRGGRHVANVEVTPDNECPDVCPDGDNIMSYHISVDEFSACQIERALFARREEFLGLLRETLRNGREDLKLLSAQLLGAMRDQQSVPLLIESTRDRSGKVRARAVSTLRVLCARNAVPRIRRLLETDEYIAVVKVSLVALGTLGLPEDVVSIRPFLLHPEEHVRLIASAALCMLGDSSAAKNIFASLDSKNAFVQKSAVFALGYVQSDIARRHLLSILQDKSGRWKTYARLALAEQDMAQMSSVDRLGYLERLIRSGDSIVRYWVTQRLLSENTVAANRVIGGFAATDHRGAKIAARALAATGRR